jgi:hypothetical protein
MRTALFFLLALREPQDELDKRVRIEGQRIFVDETMIYEGPWQKADVRAVDFTGRKARTTFGEFRPWKQVVVTIDGEERLRLPVRSLQKPIAWPPLRLEDVKPLLKRLTETEDGKKTFIVLLVSEKGDHEIYRGPEHETTFERKPDAFEVALAGEVLYRVTRSAQPRIRAEDVWVTLNGYRLKAGLEIPRLTPALSKGCDLHALYLAKNEPKGLSSHEEEPRGLGYTDEGARAGKRSVISPFTPTESPIDALDGLMATLYHRISMLQPGLTEVGIGWAYRRDGLGNLVIDVGASEGKINPKIFPIVYPSPGQTEVPLAFGLGSREQPNPLPEEAAPAGYPITIQQDERRRKSDPEGHLFEGSREVDCYVSRPDRPARGDWPQPGVTCLITKEKLKPGVTYTVKFHDRETAVEKEWSFTTRR